MVGKNAPTNANASSATTPRPIEAWVMRSHDTSARARVDLVVMVDADIAEVLSTL
jgi:hypothetical protein